MNGSGNWTTARQASGRVGKASRAPAVIIHPNLAELWRRRVAELEQLPADPEPGTEAMDLIRSIITQIKVTPQTGAAGVDLEPSDDVTRILHLYSTGSQNKAPRPLRTLTMSLASSNRWSGSCASIQGYPEESH